MVTEIKGRKANTSKGNGTHKEVENQADMHKRGKALNATAIKLANEALPALQSAFACSAFYAVYYGRCELLNDLYTGFQGFGSNAGLGHSGNRRPFRQGSGQDG